MPRVIEAAYTSSQRGFDSWDEGDVKDILRSFYFIFLFGKPFGTISAMSSDPTDSRQRLEINDARPIRALAHPARIAALTHLFQLGPATATELGEVVGLSPSAMSYHLRLLEGAGLVEPAPTRGDGRERVWQSPHSGLNLNTDTDSDPDVRKASVEFLEAYILSQEMSARRYLRAPRTTPNSWIRATSRPQWWWSPRPRWPS